MKFSLDREYVAKALDAGHFILFLDGFDEVIHEKRSDVTQFIQDFTKNFGKNAVLVTSRPDPGLEGWQQFSLFQVAPLTIDQARSLVEKLSFDNDIKSKFLLDLRADLFGKHRSFLSNPLLLSIMLLSYGQSATIPNKLTVFYNQAYEALYERHDTLKDGFRRKRLTPLDIQDFARLFSAFCLLAFDKRKLEFTHTEALEYIEKSEEIIGLDVLKDNYLNDLIQAVCLLVQDGLSIVYSHRSFQEYFAARFISEARSDVQERLIKKYSSQILMDNVMSMLHEMRPEAVEQYYIVPALNETFTYLGIKGHVGLPEHHKFVLAIFSSMMLHPDGFGGTITDEHGMHLHNNISFALHRCGHLVGWKGYRGGPKQKAMLEKYQGILESDNIDLHKSKHRSKFIKDLAASDGHLSLDTLRKLIEIRDALIEKARRGEQSLENILGSKQLKQGHSHRRE